VPQHGADIVRPLPRLTDRRIGLLGGSFNPAHEGHVHISLEALKRLGLDEVWWLVSPQNPLKAANGMASLADRMNSARAITAPHPRLRVTDLERALGTRYTIDTVRALRQRHPHARFVWLMGADNLAQIDRWHAWQQIFHLVPVAVWARPSYCFRALAAKAARRFAGARLQENAGRLLPATDPPAWVFVHGRLNPLSATLIRTAPEAARRRRTKPAAAKGR